MNAIATIKKWNIEFYKKNLNKLPGKWTLISNEAHLTKNFLYKKGIKSIYFIHWSKIIKKEIYENFNCIAFHMTDLPYGRGGSPLQNLILKNKKNTKITAFKINNIIDGGPIYLKKNLKLNGRAIEIFKKATKITLSMILEIEKKKLQPKPQKDCNLHFKRLKPLDNKLNLKIIKNLNRVYDLIRMVDAPTYSGAYIEEGNFIVKFKDISRKKNSLICKAEIITKVK